MSNGCWRCEAEKGKDQRWVDHDELVECFQCKKPVKLTLGLHHTRAALCSFDCEAQYWLDILY